MPINRQMGREDVVHIYNGLLLCHKNESNNAICSNMDGSRDYHIKWSKSDRDKSITHMGFPDGSDGKESACNVGDPGSIKTLVLGKIECKRRSRPLASLTQWTWVWESFGRQWRTGRPGVLQFMESQTVRHDLVTEQNNHSYVESKIWYKSTHI